MHKSMISITAKIVLAFIFALIGSIFVLLVLLLDGISVQSYEISGIHVEKLYIKLDKKLVVEADKISVKRAHKEIKESKVKELQELTKWLDMVQNSLEFFQRVRIESLVIDDEEGFFLYDDGVFSVDSKPLAISALLEYDNHTIRSNRLKVLIKDFNITIDGSGEYNLKNEKANIDAKYDISGIVNGNALLYFEESRLFYELNTSDFKSMDFLKSIVEIENPNVSAWIYENIKAEGFMGSNIRGTLDLKNPKYEDLLGLSANLIIENPKIKFNPNLKSVDAQKIEANLTNNTLYFTLFSPSFQGIDLNGSSVYITNLFTTPAMLNINLKSRAQLDDKIAAVLKTYRINLPLKQLSGTTSAELNLSLSLEDYELDAQGRFESSRSRLKLNELEIYAKKLNAELNNSQVYIYDSQASISTILSGDEINMKIDTKKSQIIGDMRVEDFNLTFDTTRLASIKDKKMGFEIDFSKGTQLIVDEIALKATFGKEGSTFFLKDISLIKGYSPFLSENNITKGRFEVKTPNFRNFRVDAHIEEFNTNLAKKSGEKLNGLDVTMDISAKTIKGRTKDGLVEFEVKDAINIKLKELMLLVNLEDAEKKTKQGGKKSPKIYIEAQNSDIMLGKRRLLADSYKLYNETNLVSLELFYKGTKLTINTMGKHGSINAINLSDFYLNTYFGKEIFFGGIYNVNASIIEDIIKGTITTERAKIKNLTTLNNLLAFIDTIPSLVIFKKPGFNADGYEVERGRVDFGYSSGYFVAENIVLDGSSIDIKGNGVIDTNKDTIDLSLRLLTLKSLSSIIGSIPLLGYIIMGDDKSIGTDVRVRGSLDNPQVESQILEDTIKSPLNIIERIIKTPGRLLN